ncbi:YIP1 family protein [Anaeromassilibacillus sp. SJQ-5]
MNKLKMGMLFLLLLAVLCGTMTVSAAEAPYETYVFAYDSSVQITPNAYLPAEKIAAFRETLLKNPSDMVVDEERGLIAIADTGNNRIVLLNRNFEVTGTIGPFALPNGTEDTFDSPSGVFITEEDWLVVADTNHGRLVVFDKDNRYLRTIDGPPAQVLPENFKYNPISVAVNAAGQFYVVSKNSNMGVMALDGDGGFQGFIGAQRVASNAAQLLWRAFMTEEQLARSVQFVPVEYSSLTIDHKGFVYVTCSSIDRFELYNTIHSRSMDSTYAPVKKINPAGTDVLRRNGFFPPAGDINFSPYDGDEAVGPSQISKVILLDNGMYMLLDSYGNKLFTYDSSGNLLFAFGGKGEALGLFSRLSAAAAWGDELLALDAETGAITVFRKTAYGTLLDEVIGYQENREYDKAQGLWNELLGENNNFDLAYLGVGKALMEKGDLTGAMKYFELINNKLYYSKAYGLYRQEILQRWGLWILLGVLILILLAVWVFRKIAVHNQKTLASPAGGRLRDALLLGFYVIFHPFNGYWALKGEKRGGVRSATILLALACLTQAIAAAASGFLSGDEEASVGSGVLNLLAPLLLWCIANTCFTSLMDGKGSFRDVYVAVGTSTLPVTLLVLPCTVVSHFLILEELPILAMVTNVAYIWMAALIFFSMITVHDYTLGKNVLVSILTVLGMAFILFLLFIFVSLIGRMISLVSAVGTELSLRT